MAISLITIKSAAGGQGFFSSVIRTYIEETAASAEEQTDSKLAYISEFFDLNGQGGPDAAIGPVTVQDSYIHENNPASTDYLQYLKPNKITEYTVQPGDAISFIASDFGVTVNTILWANNIKNADAISLGQVLKIPPVSGVVHTVKSGDTIGSIAQKYSGDEAKILEFNGIKNASALQIGVQLVIPDGKMSAIAKSSASTSTTRKFSYLPDLGDYFLVPTVGYNWGIIHGRNGVDMANTCGTTIYAAASGTAEIATSSGYNGGFGKYIKLVHPNGTETLYAHLSKLLIEKGSYVAKGAAIGLMGTTGRSTGCHLHFEVHGAQNPLIN